MRFEVSTAANQALQGEINRSIIYNHIRENSPVSRTEVARTLRISPSAVTRVVNALVRQRYILEAEKVETPVGKEARHQHLPHVTPTRPASLFTAGLSGLVVGYGLTSLLDQLGHGLPRVSWVAVVLLLFLASLLLAAVRRVRAWVNGDRPQEPGDALTMGRLVALAKAGSIFGAFMTGAYVGLASVGLDRVDTDYGRGHVLWAAAGAVAAGAVLLSALLLERSLRLPDDGAGGAPGAT